ncbi:hypothetical protein BGW39_001095 [Mortierella sp. 14UC]|nr:hypothetical protein BGW39_001095 [Mortierella sp. 14UC]
MTKIKLHKDQKAYLETTAGSDITLTGFVKATNAPLGAVELENIWSHAAIPYLANHTSLNKQQAARRLLKHKIKQRLAEFKTAVMMRDHTSNLMVHVTQELELAASHHVKEYRSYVLDGDGLKHAQELTDDDVAEEKLAEGPLPKRSRQQNTTNDLLGALLPSEDDTSDFRTASLPSTAQSSVNSIEVGFFNRLVGRGTTSCRLRTQQRIIIDGLDVSHVLMEIRRGLLRKQSEIRDVDELLTLNFVFQPSLLKRHLPSPVWKRLSRVDHASPNSSDIEVIAATAVFAAQNPFQETRAFIKNKHLTEQSMSWQLLNAYTRRPGLWQTPESFPSATQLLGLNEDSYIENAVKGIVHAIVGDLEVIDHWGRDPFPTPPLFDEQYFPDYFAELDGFPFVVAEVKKPGDVLQGILRNDERKVPSLLKLALDRMLEAGIVEPKAIGILVQDSRCLVSVQTLEKEAVYLDREIGLFQIPTSNIQLGLLLAAISPLSTARDIVKQTYEAIEGRSGQVIDSTKPWRRPSYHLKAVRIPTPIVPIIDDDKEE